MSKAPNYLKIRDDLRIIALKIVEPPTGKSDDKTPRFEIKDEALPSWAAGHSPSLSEVRNAVEPWLTALFQSEHLSLLVGAGLMHAIHNIATGDQANARMDITLDAGNQTELIQKAAKNSARRSGRQKPNVEDQIRVANELQRGYEILGKSKQATKLKTAINSTLKALAESALKSERNIAKSSKRTEAISILVNFLASFASRTGTRDRLHIFTTNYDRLIEEGAELAGIHLLDRFIGTLSPVFRASRLDLDLHYNPPGIRGEPRYLEGVARFSKLHGSLDWIQAGNTIRRAGIPFGANRITPYLKAPGLKQRCQSLMIFPNSAKDWETTGYPFAELFRDFSAAICRPNSTLVTYGYGFGDDHINRVIEDMLTIPSTHLVAISRDDPFHRMVKLAESRPSQVTLIIGPELADITTLTKHLLPKAAIDRATGRMSELLRNRYGGTLRTEPLTQAETSKGSIAQGARQ